MHTLYSAIVSFGKVTPEQREEVEKFGLAIYSWEEFLQLVGYVISYIILFMFSCLSKNVGNGHESVPHESYL